MLKTKFFSSGPVKLPNGTQGIFIKNSGLAMTIYDFGSDVVSPTTSLPATTSNPTAVGIPSTMVTAKSQPTATTYKYNFPTTITSSGTSLTAIAFPTGATTNSTTAVFMVGTGAVPIQTSKYKYAGDIVTAGGNMASGSQNFSSCARQSIGNSTTGVFPKADVAANPTNGTMKYDYASDISTVGGNLTVTCVNTYGASISAFGIIHNNTSSGTITNKYTFAGDTAAATTVLSTGAGAGAGNATYALFANTSSNVDTAKYIYAGDTVLDGTTLGINQPSLSGAGGASNGVSGVSA